MSMSDDPRGFRRSQGGSRDHASRQGRGGRAGPPAEERYEGYRQPEAPAARPQRPQADKPQPTFSAYKPEAYAKPEPGPAVPPERPDRDVGGRGGPPRSAQQGDPYSRPSQDPFYSDAPSDPYAPRSSRGFEPDWPQDPYQDTAFPDNSPPPFPDTGPPSAPNYYPPMDDGSPSGPDAQSMHDRFFPPDMGGDEIPPPPLPAGRFPDAFDEPDFGRDEPRRARPRRDEPRRYNDEAFAPEHDQGFSAAGFGDRGDSRSFDDRADPYQFGDHDDQYQDDAGAYDDQSYDWDRYEQGPPPVAAPRPPMDEDDLDADFFADEDEFDDEYEPEERGGRKKLIAAVLTGAVVVGGGLAYMYKATSGDGGGSPSVITADSSPVKEEPADPGGRDFPNGNKQIYDRLIGDGGNSSAQLAGGGNSAQLASSGSEGADQAATVDGVITTGSGALGSGTLEERIENALRTQGGAPEPSGAAEPSPDTPRSVRTVTFGPDGSQQPVEPQGQRVVVAPDVSDGIYTTGRSGGASAQGNAASGVQIAPAAEVAAPDNSVQDSGARIASISPQPEPSQSAPVTDETSGFFVQIGARNDQNAAQAALPTLQQRYVSVIGDSPFSVRKVDLGAKGVWYRMLIGPYNSKGEADTVCEQLKGAGMRECLSRKY